MLKQSSILILLLLVVSGCMSSEKLLQKGRYDKAIDKAVEKLQKDPSDEKELRVLKEAYLKANSFDNDRIEFLRQENREENWVEIYQLYERLDRRQDHIETLPSPLLSEFELRDYNNQIIEAKKRAASISYDQGIQYLDRGGRYNARLAYREFERAKSIYSNYRDVDAMMAEALYQGTNRVLFRIENNSEKVLPDKFDEELRKIGLEELNGGWIEYHTYADTSIYYDYYIILNINTIEVSPESVDREKYTESAEVQDGMKYVYDEDGNVKKDSLGNDIKVPNMVTVSAEIVETLQHKEAIVGGSIDYLDLRSDQLVKTENVSVTAVFEHYSAVYNGDKRALSDETQKRVGGKPVPFPPDETMLIDAATLLKDRSKAIIYNNRSLLQE